MCLRIAAHRITTMPASRSQFVSSFETKTSARLGCKRAQGWAGPTHQPRDGGNGARDGSINQPRAPSRGARLARAARAGGHTAATAALAGGLQLHSPRGHSCARRGATAALAAGPQLHSPGGHSCTRRGATAALAGGPQLQSLGGRSCNRRGATAALAGGPQLHSPGDRSCTRWLVPAQNSDPCQGKLVKLTRGCRHPCCCASAPSKPHAAVSAGLGEWSRVLALMPVFTILDQEPYLTVIPRAIQQNLKVICQWRHQQATQ